MFVLHKLLVRHHMKYYDCENNDKNWQKSKISAEKWYQEEGVKVI